MAALLADRHALDQHRECRLRAQADFVAALAALPDADPAWRELPERARAAFAADSDSARGMAAGEALLAPAAAAARSHTIHCVGHAHIDMNWMWDWPETVAATLDTFRTVTGLLDEFPDFVFSQSQVSVYAIMRDHDPELFAGIRRHIASGRWEVTASHWVEGERNLAGGEALCRQLAEARRFCRDELGLAPEEVPVDWSPDTFGHAAIGPDLAAAAGVRFMYACRTGDIARPPAFVWRGPAGGELLVHRELGWYLGEPDAAKMTGHLLAYRAATGLRDWMLVYGIGDHGGGPTRRDIRRLLDMAAWPVFPRIRLARCADFFAVLAAGAKRLPVHVGDLNYEFTGCYTSQSRLKRGNRQGEALCAEADTAAALVDRLGGPRLDQEARRAAWQDVLFGHFHDILPGSGVRATREWQLALLQRVRATCGQQRVRALRSLAARVDRAFAGPASADPADPGRTPTAFGAGAGRLRADLPTACHAGAGPRPLVLVNPLAWDRQAVATATLWDGDEVALRDGGADGWHLRWPDGTSAPVQALGTAQPYWFHACVDLALPPLAVPALGWQAVALVRGAAGPSRPGLPAPTGLATGLDGGHGHRSNRPEEPWVLANGLLRVEVERESGSIRSLVDISSGCEFAAGGLARLEVVRERPRPMSSWELGDEDGAAQPLRVERIEPGARGPWLASLTVHLARGATRVQLTVALHAGAREVELGLVVDWQEAGGPEVGTPRLVLALPTALGGASLRCESPFGADERPAGRTVPALRWALVSGAASAGAASLAVLGDGQHGVRLRDGRLEVSVLRASYDPDPDPERGEHRCRMLLRPRLGGQDDADLLRAAMAHEHPLQVVPAAAGGGDLPAAAALVACEPAAVVPVQIKPADDGDGLVVRLVNTGAGAAAARLRPSPLLGLARAQGCDLLERPTGGLAWEDGGARIPLAPHAVASVRLT